MNPVAQDFHVVTPRALLANGKRPGGAKYYA